MNRVCREWEEALQVLGSADEEGCWSFVIKLDAGWSVIFGYGWTVGVCDDGCY